MSVPYVAKDYKVDQFVNGPPVYKPVIQFLKWLARF